MKYLFVLILLFIVSGPLMAGEFTLIENAKGQLLVKWEMKGDYTITPYKEEYVLVDFPGGTGNFGDGKPQLPSQQIFVEVPKDANVSLQIVKAIPEIVTLEKQVYPAQPCPTDTIGEQDKPREFVKDEVVYASSKVFPGVLVQVVRKGLMRGRHLLLLRVNPIQYIPKSNKLVVHKEIEFKLNYPDARAEIADTDTAMDPIAQSLILNYQAGKNRELRGPEYLIITHDDYIDKVNEFATWKTQQGFATKVVKLSSITSLSSPSATAIKAEVKKYYPGLVYLLLVGDSQQIPLPTSAKNDVLGNGPELYANSTPSDLCYVLLEGNDYYPELYHGRIPAGTVSEANTMFNKILFYEKTPDTGNWYKRFLLCGEFQYQYGQKNRAERLFCETAYVITENLKHLYTFPQNTIGTGSSGLGHSEYFFRKETYRHKIKDPNGMNCKMPASWSANIQADTTAKQNTLAFWSQGAFLVQHRDHGSKTSWGKPSLSRNDVASLNNGNKLPVLFSINCLTGAIDNSSGDCFVEAALKNQNGGAVAALAATRVSYSWWNDTLCDGFYTCLFGSSVYDSMRDSANPAPNQPARSNRLGVILNYGKMYLTVNYPDNPWNSNREEIEFYLFHCFAPPDMQIRTQSPTIINVACPKTAKIGESIRLVVTNTAKAPIVGAKVCFYQDGILYTGKTNVAGEFTADLTIRGKVKVTVSGANLYPIQQDIVID